jgi:saccharopine dehydrogenase-like NADP-dependent oxidoreductase
MQRIVVLGAGKIGGALAELLHVSGDYAVVVADHDSFALDQLDPAVQRRPLDFDDAAAVERLLAGAAVAISAAPFFVNPTIARAARAANVHYLDLTEDVAVTRAVRDVAAGAEAAFIPQCGLAPGFISIVAHHLVQHFDGLRDVRLRVGALPQFPDNALKYYLTWSTDGLINEYCNPCEVIHDDARREVLPMEGLERFSFDGVDYEAFYTSGGIGTLCETLDGQAGEVNYKTVRYPGHRDIMRFLLHDLRLRDRRPVLKDVLEHAIPMTLQDVVLIFVTVNGQRDGRLTTETYARKIYGEAVGGRPWSAIQLTTASAAAAVADLLCSGALPHRGFVRQEQIDFDAFIANRFGRRFA